MTRNVKLSQLEIKYSTAVLRTVKLINCLFAL